jgi:DegV family protein with EDD domain
LYTVALEVDPVPEIPTVLVADSSEERRRSLGLKLYEGGYEVINAVNGEEALRFTAGLNPTLVIAHTGLEGMEPLDLHSRLQATGLEIPPFLILSEEVPELPDDYEEGTFYCLASVDLEPVRFLHQVRLLLLTREIGGELSDSLDVLYGDLTRIPVGDLLQVLLKFLITGRVSLSVGPDAGIWLDEGEVIEAHWGQVEGRKAFNRVAGLRGGSFVLSLEEPPVERSIDLDLTNLITAAVEEKHGLEEVYDRLPSLNSKLELKMGEDFFSVEFSPVERDVLARVQDAKNLGDLVDLVPALDLEVLEVAEGLQQRGFLDIKEPEHRIHIVTDSTCDLLPSLTRRHNITVVPLSVLFGNKMHKDGIDLQPDQFYTMLQESDVFPSTSPPGKGEFLEVYRRLVSTGDIISIHISKKQSETAAHAEEAVAEGAEEFARLRQQAGLDGEPVIRVVDSWSNCVGLGMQVIFASRMAQRGLKVDEIVSRIEGIRERIHFLFLVDTLEFLKKGGRIGGAQAFLGTLLGIKPILGQQHGEVVPVDKVRGGRKAQPRLIELFKERIDTAKPIFVAIAHAQAPKWAGRLRDSLQETFSIAELLEMEIGPVIGAHAGPGAVGAIVFQPQGDELELLKPEE